MFFRCKYSGEVRIQSGEVFSRGYILRVGCYLVGGRYSGSWGIHRGGGGIQGGVLRGRY